jgi:regulation of enolase protein 1 (concanavalin A-like superfamily)
MTSRNADLTWLNPPPHCTFGDNTVHVRTGMGTDFWRETFYGFWRDNGHFLSRQVEGDFSAEVTVKGNYEVLYDQAGLMVRLSETHWIKAGIEYTDGLMYFSVVVTNDASDWSLAGIPADPDGVRIRLTRHAETIRVQYLDASAGHWRPVRLACLPRSNTVEFGLVACCPKAEDFDGALTDFRSVRQSRGSFTTDAITTGRISQAWEGRPA